MMANAANSKNLSGLKLRGASHPGKLGRNMSAVICAQPPNFSAHRRLTCPPSTTKLGAAVNADPCCRSPQDQAEQECGHGTWYG